MTDAGPDPYTISTDPERLDRDRVHHWLAVESYWARGIPRDVFERSLAGSLCFGVYDGDSQVAFARVISDRATIAYLGDVFVAASHRGRGIGRALMRAVMTHPDLQGLRRWILLTRDAQALYAREGFTSLRSPDRWMECHDSDAYRIVR